MKVSIKFANEPRGSSRHIAVDISDEDGPSNLKARLSEAIASQLDVDIDEFALVGANGVPFTYTSSLRDGDLLQLCPLVLGGKGGFGSLLRAFGKQITLSTNKEACRDLTGRRIRHINNEKKLKDFLMRQSELAKRKDAEKKEKAERRRKKRDQMENTHHIFLDPKYDQQKQKIDQDLDDAIQKAAKAERLVMKSKKRKLGAASSSSGPISSADAQQEEESKGKEVTDETVTLPKSTEETRRDEVTKVTAATDETTSTVVQASAASVTVVPVKLVEVKETKKTVDKFKDWMGVGDLDVSSSSSEDDDQPENVPVKKSKKY